MSGPETSVKWRILWSGHIFCSKRRCLPRKVFPVELFESDTSIAILPAGSSPTLAQIRRRGIEEIERNYIKQVLARNRGRINESAREAGISTRQLNKLMTKYGIRKEEFKNIAA